MICCSVCHGQQLLEYGLQVVIHRDVHKATWSTAQHLGDPRMDELQAALHQLNVSLRALEKHCDAADDPRTGLAMIQGGLKLAQQLEQQAQHAVQALQNSTPWRIQAMQKEADDWLTGLELPSPLLQPLQYPQDPAAPKTDPLLQQLLDAVARDDTPRLPAKEDGEPSPKAPFASKDGNREYINEWPVRSPGGHGSKRPAEQQQSNELANGDAKRHKPTDVAMVLRAPQPEPFLEVRQPPMQYQTVHGARRWIARSSPSRHRRFILRALQAGCGSPTTWSPRTALRVACTSWTAYRC